MPTPPRTPLPPRLLPVLYFGVAHAALTVACLEVALDPRGVSGFFYHPRMLAMVHLLPIFYWYWAYANTGYQGPVPSLHEMPWRLGQQLAFALWLFGVPALAGGLTFDAIPLVSAAAWSLFAAALLSTANVSRILRYAFITPCSRRRGA
jgi:hypothetical protein